MAVSAIRWYATAPCVGENTVCQAEIPTMDEPLSALDDKTRSKMQRLILDVHAETGNTIIMVTHSQDEAFKMCDRINRI